MQTDNIILNKTRIDWFTLTTYDGDTALIWKLYTLAKLSNDFIPVTQRMQYSGFQVKLDNGSVFFGSGEIKGKLHHMLQVSGSLAGDIYVDFVDGVIAGKARCTRIDIQRTIEQPVWYDALKYEASCEANGLKPTKRRSNAVYGDGELITVYSGTRTSGRFNRLYQKQSENGDYLLRYETEYSREYAHKVAYGIAWGETPASHLNAEIQRRGLAELAVFNDDNADVRETKMSAVRAAGNTEKWLLETVLPTLVRHMSEHGQSDRVYLSFKDAIERQEWVNNIQD